MCEWERNAFLLQTPNRFRFSVSSRRLPEYPNFYGLYFYPRITLNFHLISFNWERIALGEREPLITTCAAWMRQCLLITKYINNRNNYGWAVIKLATLDCLEEPPRTRFSSRRPSLLIFSGTISYLKIARRPGSGSRHRKTTSKIIDKQITSVAFMTPVLEMLSGKIQTRAHAAYHFENEVYFLRLVDPPVFNTFFFALMLNHWCGK